MRTNKFFIHFLMWKINLKTFLNIFENQFTKSVFLYYNTILEFNQLDGKDGKPSLSMAFILAPLKQRNFLIER